MNRITQQALLNLCPDVISRIKVLKWIADGRSADEIVESLYNLGLCPCFRENKMTAKETHHLMNEARTEVMAYFPLVWHKMLCKIRDAAMAGAIGVTVTSSDLPHGYKLAPVLVDALFSALQNEGYKIIKCPSQVGEQHYDITWEV